MVISADDGQRMLSTKRSDPDVVGRNGRSRFFEFGTDGRIGDGGSILDVENAKFVHMFLQPLLIVPAVAGVPNSVSIFSEHYHRNSQVIRFAKKGLNRRFALHQG